MKKTILFIFAFSNMIGNVSAQSYSVVVDNVIYRMRGSDAIAESCCADSGFITIHDSVSFTECPPQYRGVYSVTEVGQGCFQRKENITGVSLPNTLSKIGARCFAYCTRLTDISLPNSINEIGNGAFEYTGITSINIPNNLNYLRPHVFRGCQSLGGSIHSPYLRVIDEGCFLGCTSLTEIDAPSAWVYFGCSLDGAFEGCTNLRSARLGGSVSYKCFCGCSNLEYVECNINPVEYGWEHFIGKNAFRGCTSLKYINMGYCSKVDEAAFSLGGGQSLDTIKVLNTDPSYKDWAYYGSTFNQDIDVSHVVVVVPCNLKQLYENQSYCGRWSFFWNIIEDCGGSHEGIETSIDTNEINIYSIEGRVYVSGTGVLDATLYSRDGRRIETIQDGQTTQALPSGVYMVKVGTLPARKVVVIR